MFYLFESLLCILIILCIYVIYDFYIYYILYLVREKKWIVIMFYLLVKCFFNWWMLFYVNIRIVFNIIRIFRGIIK